MASGSVFDGITEFFENLQNGMAMAPSAATLAKEKKVPHVYEGMGHILSCVVCRDQI